jgi:hypothetical protein
MHDGGEAVATSMGCEITGKYAIPASFLCVPCVFCGWIPLRNGRNKLRPARQDAAPPNLFNGRQRRFSMAFNVLFLCVPLGVLCVELFPILSIPEILSENSLCLGASV